MRVLITFKPQKALEKALDRGEKKLWFGTHMPVPGKDWRLFYSRLHRKQKFLITAMEGKPEELATYVPEDSLCVLEEGETLPVVKRNGHFAIRHAGGYDYALDLQGKVWPGSAIRLMVKDVIAC